MTRGARSGAYNPNLRTLLIIATGGCGGWFVGDIFRQQDVQHGAERLGPLLWKRQKIPRSDFREILLFMIPNHPVVHWVKKSFKPHG
jgi:hypothetical protein